MSLPAILLSLCLVFVPALGQAGDYLNSAHGSAKTGVSRSEKAKTGFATANCSHCHEFHGGTEISGAGASDNEAYPFSLFAPNFDTKNTTGVYTESTNICFSCHYSRGSAQRVPNKNISRGMGCSALPGTDDIMEQFNQASRHNLFDIWKFMEGADQQFSWFSDQSNPCSGCHNPHIARSKSKNPKDPGFTSLSRPTQHDDLWTQTMQTAYSTQYEPPFCSSTGNREPAASPRPDQARESMLDYVTLCTDCHNDRNTIYSTTLERNLAQIDWSVNGDGHGGRGATSPLTVKPPYVVNSAKNYVLSCLDCHEPHGSANSALLRGWVNGGKLLDTITTSIAVQPGTGTNSQNIEMGYLCARCHEQDAESGTNADNPPRWQTLHHGTEESPYTEADCESCHELDEGGSSEPLPINCINCHFHGSTDSWLKEMAIDKKTF